MNLPKKCDHSHNERNDSLGKQAELAVLQGYVENQATIETILTYRASKCKQTNEQDSKLFMDPYFYFFVCIISFFSFPYHCSKSYLYSNLGRDIQMLP